jgi:putative membrane protein
MKSYVPCGTGLNYSTGTAGQLRGGAKNTLPAGRSESQLPPKETRMLWLKAFHVVFVVTWFAGIFYLPRLFLYHAAATDAPTQERFQIMERRLFGIMTIGASLTLLFGISMVVVTPALLAAGWLRAKLTLVLLLIGYHVWCYVLMRDLRAGRNSHSSTWYRLFNEAPTLLLIGIVILVVVKPF